jgi:hypothetical protein
MVPLFSFLSYAQKRKNVIEHPACEWQIAQSKQSPDRDFRGEAQERRRTAKSVVEKLWHGRHVHP